MVVCLGEGFATVCSIAVELLCCLHQQVMSAVLLPLTEAAATS